MATWKAVTLFTWASQLLADVETCMMWWGELTTEQVADVFAVLQNKYGLV